MNRQQKKINTTAALTPKPFQNKKWAWLALIVFGLILYANTLGHQYALDDEMVITKNYFTQQGIQGIDEIFEYDTFTGWYLVLQQGLHENAKAAQKANNILAGGRYRPLSLATFALEIGIFGTRHPAISHAINIILYILTVLLLYLILLRLFPPRDEKQWYLSLAFIASMLFMAHPLHTEVVANIKGRDEIFALLGALGALWFSIRFIDKNQYLNLLWAFLCFLGGLLSKENTITFLALIPLSIYYFVEHRNWKQIAIACSPLLLASVIFLMLRWVVLDGFMTAKDTSNYLLNNPFIEATAAEKYATISFTLLKYLQLLIFPHPLTWDYYPYHIPIIGWTDWRAIVPVVLYVAMGIFALAGLKKRNILSYCIWAYLIPLSIVSNIFFPVGVFMSERFIYMSSIGFCIFLAWILVDILPRYIHKKLIIIALCIIIGILYTIKSISRNRAWENDTTLYTTDIKVSKNSAKTNYQMGCIEFMKIEKNHFRENTREYNDACLASIKYMDKTVEVYPEYFEAYCFLGLAWNCYQHHAVLSLQNNLKAMKLRPKELLPIENTKSTLNTALMDISQNKLLDNPADVLAVCQEIEKINDNIPILYQMKGVIYGQVYQNLDMSLNCFNKALELGYDDASLYNNMSTAYYLKKDFEKTIWCYENMLRLRPNDSHTYFLMSYVYNEMGEKQKSAECYAKSEQLKKQETNENSKL